MMSPRGRGVGVGGPGHEADTLGGGLVVVHLGLLIEPPVRAAHPLRGPSPWLRGGAKGAVAVKKGGLYAMGARNKFLVVVIAMTIIVIIK